MGYGGGRAAYRRRQAESIREEAVVVDICGQRCDLCDDECGVVRLYLPVPRVPPKKRPDLGALGISGVATLQRSSLAFVCSGEKRRVPTQKKTQWDGIQTGAIFMSRLTLKTDASRWTHPFVSATSFLLSHLLLVFCLFVCLFFFCILQGFVRFYFKSIHSQENLVQCNRNPGSIQVKSSIPILRNKTRSKPHNKSKSGWPTRCLSREAAADRVLLSFKKACAPSWLADMK